MSREPSPEFIQSLNTLSASAVASFVSNLCGKLADQGVDKNIIFPAIFETLEIYPDMKDDFMIAMDRIAEKGRRNV